MNVLPPLAYTVTVPTKLIDTFANVNLVTPELFVKQVCYIFSISYYLSSQLCFFSIFKPGKFCQSMINASKNETVITFMTGDFV
jgi:hypothetical protein